MVHLGGTPAEKALAVNLDDKFYGSFAEIGAGQEVSRTFLQAGAAAGTVARSISAYDMKMSDVNYGQAKRYVTRERLEQMLNTEYDLVEKTLRKQRGDDACFFAFATTVAAKAYNSDRECEGWVGLTYQSKPGEERSTVILHIRMSQPTAQLQGEAIGVLGTNLIYLCKGLSDPYLITSFLLDGMALSDEPGGGGRIEVDYVDFKGPPFQSVDPRLLAFRLIQLRIANGVILQPDSNGNYKMAVPNNFLYKCPVIVERSRFKPVTFMHTEVLEATSSWSLAIRDWVLSDVEDKNFHEHLPYMYIYICIHVVLLFLQRELEDSGFLCASGFAIWRDISKKNSFNQAT
ncbi:unnamed protein product [Durusdinium trenchii]|uniref:Uncharacterized protein n=2 Tax=Durusdinium trenchii TaxID=1381693 RepID=A0ABP0RPH3_9DINO